MSKYPILEVNDETNPFTLAQAVIKHVEDQGAICKSESHPGLTGCVYRNDLGQACAVGAFLTDDQADFFDNAEDGGGSAASAVCIELGWHGEIATVMVAAQNAHDMMAEREPLPISSFPDVFRRKLKQKVDAGAELKDERLLAFIDEA